MAIERIQKILAHAGIASRRDAEKMMLEGRIMVNGRVITTLGFKADPSKDHVKVDGKRVQTLEPKVTLLLNKPRGFLSTVEDPEGRPTVMNLLKRVKGRLYPVGRLDFDAEGLLLITNDGSLTYHLSHPKFSVPKTYQVKVIGMPDAKKLTRLKKGILLEDGRASVVSARILRGEEKHSWIEVVVTEGRNRLIKRIFETIGHPVLKLKRIQYGPLELGNLPIGQYRFLTSVEMEKLKALMVRSR